MLEQFLQAILEQLKEPKADIEKNLRALLAEMILRMDLVSQEEFMRQQTALTQAQLSIQQLIGEIEKLNEKLTLLESNTAP